MQQQKGYKSKCVKWYTTISKEIRQKLYYLFYSDNFAVSILQILVCHKPYFNIILIIVDFFEILQFVKHQDFSVKTNNISFHLVNIHLYVITFRIFHLHTSNYRYFQKRYECQFCVNNFEQVSKFVTLEFYFYLTVWLNI